MKSARIVLYFTLLTFLSICALELLSFETQMQREESDEDDDNRPPFIYDVDTLEKALGQAAEDPESYSPNRKKLAELQKRFKELIPGDEGSGDEEEEDDEVPTLVEEEEQEEQEEDEELEEMDEDDEEAKKSGWKNEFTAAEIIAEELKEDPKDIRRRQRKDNGLLGGKIVSMDASTLDISGLESKASTTTDEEPSKSKKKKNKKIANQEAEAVVEEPEPVLEEEEEEETTMVFDEEAEVSTKITKKKKSVQWVLDQNTIRRKY